MCVFFHRRHTETSTEGVQAGGVVVFIVGMEQRHPAGSRKNETFSQQEQTPSTGDHRRAYRGRTETTKGNMKGGGNKRRTKAYSSRETYYKRRKWWRCCTLYLLQRSKRWLRQSFTELLFLKTPNNKNLW